MASNDSSLKQQVNFLALVGEDLMNRASNRMAGKALGAFLDAIGGAAATKATDFVAKKILIRKNYLIWLLKIICVALC